MDDAARLERRQQGFALAAVSRGDRGAELALPGLTAACAGQLSTIAQRLRAAERAERRDFVRRMLSQLEQIAPQQGDRNPRALGLLATSVERTVGRAWLAAAPPPRAGYAPDPALLAVLRRLARDAKRGA